MRIENAGKNAIAQLIATLVTTILGLFNRYIFNIYLGAEYLGISSLFTTILGVLSFADFGVINSFTYCLYKPIVRGENDYIKVLLYYLKRIMLYVMLGIGILSICFMPFLRKLANGAEMVDDAYLYFYYLLSIIDLLSTYICSYQICYIIAIQKEYKIAPIRIWYGTVNALVRAFTLLIFKDYVIYITAGTLVNIIQQLHIRRYINKNYEIVSNLKKGQIKAEDLHSLKKNTLSTVLLKFANVSINQTDSLIISAGINVVTLGLVTNYKSINDIFLGLIAKIQTSVYSSMGDLTASETKDVQLDTFYKYLMVTQLMISLCCTILFALSSPIICLLFGHEWIIDDSSVFLIYLSSLLMYHTYAVNMLPTVNGRFELATPLAVVEGVVNLIVSILAIRRFGLMGVFIGTFVAELTYFIAAPVVIMNGLYDNSKRYFLRATKGIMATGFLMFVLLIIRKSIDSIYYNFVYFITYALISLLLWLVVTFLIWHKDTVFRETVKLIGYFLVSIVKKRSK